MGTTRPSYKTAACPPCKTHAAHSDVRERARRRVREQHAQVLRRTSTAVHRARDGSPAGREAVVLRPLALPRLWHASRRSISKERHSRGVAAVRAVQTRTGRHGRALDGAHAGRVHGERARRAAQPADGEAAREHFRIHSITYHDYAASDIVESPVKSITSVGISRSRSPARVVRSRDAPMPRASS